MSSRGGTAGTPQGARSHGHLSAEPAYGALPQALLRTDPWGSQQRHCNKAHCLDMETGWQRRVVLCPSSRLDLIQDSSEVAYSPATSGLL